MYYGINQIKLLKRDIRKTSTVLSLILTSGITNTLSNPDIRNNKDDGEDKSSIHTPHGGWSADAALGAPTGLMSCDRLIACKAHRNAQMWETELREAQ